MDFEPPALCLSGPGDGRLGSIGKVLRDPLRNWPESLLWTGVTQATAAGRTIAFVAEPEAIHTILLNRGGKYPRARIHDRILGAGYGANLIQADQEDWRQQRGEIARPIGAQRASAATPRLVQAATTLLDEWAELHPGTPIPLIRDARRLALDALFRVVFANAEEAQGRDPQVDAIARQIAGAPTSDLRHELYLLVALAERLIEERPARCDPAVSSPYPLDRNTLVLFLHAGHDNVAAALVWMLWAVAHRPELQERVADEWIRKARSPFAEAGLETALAVFKETLRLYPPVMQLVRDLRDDIEVGGRKRPSGGAAILSIYAMQRQRGIWEDPDIFLPERFLGQPGLTTRQRQAYLPFGLGPRGCIGSRLAELELTLFLALICERFEILPNPECPLSPEVAWTLRPSGAVPILLRPRK